MSTTRSIDGKINLGDGATACYWSDRKAGTIVAISKGGRQVTWQQDKATRVDSNGMSEVQDYTYEADPEGTTKVFSLRKNGRWVVQGDSPNGLRLCEGRHEYHDYSF